jgi:acyl carrier protein
VTNDTVSQIREFIIENLLFGDESALSADSASLIETGVIDSTGVVELVSFIEERFGIRVLDDEVTPENLDSVSKLAKYIHSKNGDC